MQCSYASQQGTTLLVGTQGGDIVEVSVEVADTGSAALGTPAKLLKHVASGHATATSAQVSLSLQSTPIEHHVYELMQQ
jgi:hypothetical protein